MIIMGFLVVGVWYAVGYIQGYDTSYTRGFEEGRARAEEEANAKTPTITTDEQD